MMRAALPFVMATATALVPGCRSEPTPAPETVPPSAEARLTEQEATEGWKLLFDGVSPTGWCGINSDMFPKTGWQIREGALVSTGDGERDLITVDEYGEFDLRWEWLLETRGGNSGVKYYVQEQGDDTQTHGIGLEYQILDDPNHEWMLDGRMKPNDFHTVGALYELYPPSPEKAPRPVGEWNSSRIVAHDGRIQHWLNGALVLEADKNSEDFRRRVAESKFKDIEGFGRNEKGHILLQDHGSVVHFRNLKIRDLSDVE
jgi:hypothetical protein